MTKVKENDETGSFNITNSQMIWTPISLDNITILNYLNYSNDNDEAEIHLNITAPFGEPTGNKTAEFTVYAKMVGW